MGVLSTYFTLGTFISTIFYQMRLEKFGKIHFEGTFSFLLSIFLLFLSKNVHENEIDLNDIGAVCCSILTGLLSEIQYILYSVDYIQNSNKINTVQTFLQLVIFLVL